MEVRDSQFRLAILHALDWLTCPFCPEQNSPMHHQIEVIDGKAFCKTCGKSWVLSQGDF